MAAARERRVLAGNAARRLFCLFAGLAFAAFLDNAVPSAPGGESDATALAARVDQLVAAYWQSQQITPAARSDDQEFLRRVTLDLIGRIPTRGEALAFANDVAADKRAQTIARLLESPEFSIHWASVLDQIIQDRHARDGGFVKYLRQQLENRTSWDEIFRQVMLGPFEGNLKPAEAFLRKRLDNLDELTNDAARAFFGVNISCAKCHDHPLVDDWKQAHYYGMQAFFHRTHEDKKLKIIAEKDSGDVQYVDIAGNRHTAAIMFLSGQVLEMDGTRHDPRLQERIAAARANGRYIPPAFSPRQELVNVALAQKTFFSRAIVNRLWAYFLGRGLVHPLDQLHSANPPSVPGVLELLADDLAAHGYDLRRTMSAIVHSRTYQLSSRWTDGERPSVRHFALAPLRPLTPAQFAVSLLVGTGDEHFDQLATADERRKFREQWESQASQFARLLDAPADDFQSSVNEALFLSNHPSVQKLTEPAGQNLAARLAVMADASPQAQIEAAFWSVLGRAPVAEELAYLENWLVNRPDRTRGLRDLIWSLAASAEFRFNH